MTCCELFSGLIILQNIAIPTCSLEAPPANADWRARDRRARRSHGQGGGWATTSNERRASPPPASVRRPPHRSLWREGSGGVGAGAYPSLTASFFCQRGALPRPGTRRFGPRPSHLLRPSVLPALAATPTRRYHHWRSVCVALLCAPVWPAPTAVASSRVARGLAATALRPVRGGGACSLKFLFFPPPLPSPIPPSLPFPVFPSLPCSPHLVAVFPRAPPPIRRHAAY